MSNELTTTSLPDDRVALITRTVAKGATKDELALFLHVCERTGLDPLLKQIYAVKRWDSRENRQVMAIQTGIDGYRLIADRTGMYAPGREPIFIYADEEQRVLVQATAFVKKRTKDGTWHEVAASARLDEYIQKGKNGEPTKFWASMPHVMLAKVAEALALRRAFPAELSGLYTHEEMQQASTDEVPTLSQESPHPHVPQTLTVVHEAEVVPDPSAAEVSTTAKAPAPSEGNSPPAPAQPPSNKPVRTRDTSFVVHGRRYETAGLTSTTFIEFQQLAKDYNKITKQKDAARTLLRETTGFETSLDLTEEQGRKMVELFKLAVGVKE